MSAEATYAATCVYWAHGKGRVRLENGIELVAVPGNHVRGQVMPGTPLRVMLPGDGTIARIVERVEDGRPERLKASERRRRKLAEQSGAKEPKP